MKAAFDRTQSPGYMTNWAARLFARAIDRKLRAAGISSGQLPVFFALGDGEALSQKALTRAAAIEQPTMAATLIRMERDGLIERNPDPSDKRSALISLTPAAMDKVRIVREAIAMVNSAAVADLDPEETKAYLAILQRVIRALDAIPEEE
ncbi:MarR family winged helix-turn-helix transcriptional regulator [Rhodopseudomonas sp.]|uniref:MarR family winged helix-turn-helix transcriptional regulator n=1 Tax=Rhodopseudomonas sp. TaxID=1078 RepID=UPI0039E4F76D